MPTPDGGDDFVGIGGPGEGLGIIVGFSQEAVDGSLEVDNRAEHAAFEATPGEFGKEGDKAMLGATTLGSIGLILDPFKRRLILMCMLLA